MDNLLCIWAKHFINFYFLTWFLFASWEDKTLSNEVLIELEANINKKLLEAEMNMEKRLISKIEAVENRFMAKVEQMEKLFTLTLNSNSKHETKDHAFMTKIEAMENKLMAKLNKFEMKIDLMPISQLRTDSLLNLKLPKL